jgi:uncharacterized membrane protein YjgN (DUF898 family)
MPIQPSETDTLTGALDVRPSGEPQAGRRIDITFDGHRDRLLGLGAINGLLKVLTLGIYSFWAKTEVRRRLWSFTRFNGEPLEYTGTGKELFLGFLIVFGAVVLPVLLGGIAVALIFPGSKAAISVYQLLIYAVFFLLLGNAIYRAQRYRLSRTRWRGIRGALAGSPARYGWAYFWTLAGPIVAILVLAVALAWATGPKVGGAIMVLGMIAALWILPWRSNKLQRMITEEMYFGDRQLSFTGTPGPLYKRYVFAWLGSAILYVAAAASIGAYLYQTGILSRWQMFKLPPSMGEALTLLAIVVLTLILGAVITAWYRANQIKHFARHTHFDGATFRSEATGKSLMWLVLSNWFLTIAGLIGGVIIGGTMIYALGLTARAPGVEGAPANPGILPILVTLLPIIIVTTITTTFAQFRSARYFMSRLRLDGPVDLDAILQTQDTGPKRGEGLAQVFDIDAF